MTPEDIANKHGGKLEQAASQQSVVNKYGGQLQQQDEGTMGWGQVATEAIKNIPSSAVSYGGAIAEAFSSPIQTADTITALGAGVLQELLPEGFVKFIGEDKRSRDIARQVGNMLVERYGDVDSVKQTIAKDPVGFLGDVSAVLGIGSVGIPGKAGQIAKTTAAAIEPLNVAARISTKAAPAIGNTAAAIAGTTTGTGSRPITEAYKAGREGGARAEQFRANISGAVPQQEVLDIAKNALNTIRQRRSQDYVAGMKETGEAVEQISFDGISNSISSAMDRARFKDQVTDQSAAQAISSVAQDIQRWSELDPSQYHTAIGMDALKKKIGSTLESLDPKTNAYSAVKQIYDSVKSEIVRQAPKYSETMKQYQEMSDLILEIERSLSLGHKASADTTMRKLQSLMRDNVQTNYGQRVKLGELLESYGDQSMMPALAGQTLSDLAPRGIARAGAPFAGYQAISGDLGQAAAMAAASSPRVAGEAAYAAGAIPRLVSGGINRMPPSLLNAITDPVYRNIMYTSQYGDQ